MEDTSCCLPKPFPGLRISHVKWTHWGAVRNHERRVRRYEPAYFAKLAAWFSSAVSLGASKLCRRGVQKSTTPLQQHFFLRRRFACVALLICCASSWIDAIHRLPWQVSKEAALCLKYNFLANAALDRNEVTLAIDYYDKAIATGYADQQGVLLVRRIPGGGGGARVVMGSWVPGSV